MAEIIIDSVRATYNVRGEKVALLCPPHPLMGGDRFDIRLEKISSELLRRNVSVLRFDYGQPFRSGVGEVEDTKKCIGYLKDRHEHITIVGYSFGSVVASNACKYCDAAVYISPLPRVNSIIFRDCSRPKLFIVATRDQIAPPAEALELYDSASPPKKLVKIDTDHFYFGKFDVLAEAVSDFIDLQSF